MVIDGLAVAIGDGHVHDPVLFRELYIPLVLRFKCQLDRFVGEINLRVGEEVLFIEHEVKYQITGIGIEHCFGIACQEKVFENTVVGTVRLGRPLDIVSHSYKVSVVSLPGAK